MGISIGGVSGTINPATGKPWGYKPPTTTIIQPKVGTSPYVAPKSTASPSTAPRVTVTRQQAAASYSKKVQDLLARQKAEETAKLGKLQAFIAGKEPIPELRGRLAGELGIPELAAQLEPLRQRSLTLEGLLLDLPETISGRTAGTLTTEAQRRSLEASGGERLARQIRENAMSQEMFAGQLAGAQGELAQLLAAENQQFQREVFPITTELDMFADRAAREVTGYTTAFQAELDAVLADISRAEDLSDQARQRAHELAVMEREFALRRSAATQDAKTATNAAKQQLIQQLNSGAISATKGKVGEGGVGSFEKAVATYAKTLGFNDILSAYMASNQGKKYGAPAEDYKTLAQTYYGAKIKGPLDE